MAQPDLGAGFQQMSGEAVAEHMGINLSSDSGATGGALAGVARSLGIDGLIAAVPAVAGKQPDAGSLPQTPPVRAECVQSFRAEHHIPVLATLPTLKGNHHAPAIHVAGFQMGQLGVANSSGVKGHEQVAMEGSARAAISCATSSRLRIVGRRWLFLG